MTIPRIWVAIGLSLLVHAALILKMPHVRLTPSEISERDVQGPLVVHLEPSPNAVPPSEPVVLPPPTEPPARIESTPARRARREPPRERAVPAPPVLARKAAPEIAVPVRREPPVTARAPAQTDLASYVEARRRARGEPQPKAATEEKQPAAPPAEDENARANRIAAANLGSNRTPTFGSPAPGGGIFSIRRMSYDDAEFVFYGWNKDIRRNSSQLIEVRKGAHADIRIAVVRRMIAIIREHEQGDFIWESPRLGRNVTLSARMRDNAGLEEFMMREFFGESSGR